MPDTASSPVPEMDINEHGNPCPMCHKALVPDWRGKKINSRIHCCGALVCNFCWDDSWEKKKKESTVIEKFAAVVGEKGHRKFLMRLKKRLRAIRKKKRDKEMKCPACAAPLPASHEDVVAYLRLNAEKDRVWAQCLLGRQFELASGVRKYAREAERWYRAAMMDMTVLDGGPAAAYDLGMMYAEGHSLGKDVEEAKKLWTRAHNADWIPATTELGNLYAGLHGPAAGVPNHKKAAMLYRQAAKAGHAMAQNNLGYCYAHGEGVEENVYTAKAWYTKAVEQGHAMAMFGLAVAIEKERAETKEGEEKAAMPEEAMALLRRAAVLGLSPAKRYLAKVEGR